MARPESLAESMPGLSRFVRYFWPYIGAERKLIGGSLAALLVEVLLRLLEPWPLKFVFDRVTVPETTQQPGGSLDPMTVLTLAALSLVVITGLRALMAYLSTVGFALVGNRVLTEVRDDLYRHLQQLPLSYHTRARTGDLTMRVISDVGMLKEVTVTAVLPLLGNMLVLAGMLIVMFILNWQLALLSLAVFPLFLLRSVRLSNQIQVVSRKQRQREGAVASIAAESMSAIGLVKALSLESRFAQTFARDNRESMTEGVRSKRLSASLERSVDVLIAIGTALVLWYGARLVLAGALTPGDLIVFLTYLKSAFKPVKDFAKYTGRLAKASAAGDRVLDIFQQTPEIRDHPDAIEAPPLRGAVQLDGVTFAYDGGPAVLHDINLSVRPGQRVAIVGPSGNGKSTLASLLLRLYDPAWGTVKIDGFDIRRYTVKSLRRQIGVVLQDTVLFAASVRENIAYGADGVSDEEIQAAARLANAHDFIERLPEGYETVLGERGVDLSGGQRQRIAIARAAVRKAPILILDEPTTGLDEENEQAVIDALIRLSEHGTTFVISHDLEFASRADLILYLENGRIVERGSHDELLAADGRYAALYRLQSASSLAGPEPQRGLRVVAS